MGTTIVAVLAGWLTLAAPPPVQQAETPPAPPQDETKKEWVERLEGLRDHMHTAFGVGPDLTLLDPDLGLEIVRDAWPQITEFQVKTGLLKTFAFSKALPEKHPKLFQVLHLGMTDPDPKVNAYAAGYLKEYAGEDFSRSPAGYAAWYREHGDKSPADIGDPIQSAEELAAEGWQLWRQQQMCEAAEKFEQAVALDRRLPDAWNGLGWACFNSGDAETAIEAFEKCVELQPKHPAALNGLGQVYLSWREYETAEKYLKRAAPQAPAAQYGLGRLYLLTGEYREARKWLTRVARSQPDEPTVQAMLAAAREGQMPDELRRQIEPAGKPDNADAASASAEGWQQFNEGKMRSAELSFRRALAKDPDYLPALNGLGFCLLNQGNVSEAKTYFDKYLAVEPDAPGPLNGLARCLKAEGKVDEAIEAWRRGYKASPGPTANAAGLATTYLEIGEYAKAIPHFEELVNASPDNQQFRDGLNAARAGAKE